MKHTPYAFGRLLVTLTAALAIGGCDAGPKTPAGPPAPAAPTPAATRAALTYGELVALIAEPEPFAKARKLGELLPTLGPDSIPAVKEVLEEAAALELGALDYELLMRYWALHDAPGASTFALTMSPRAFRVAAIHATLRPWAKQDPQAALQGSYVFATERSDAGTAAQIALVRGWYESGQPGLEEYIRGLGAGFERQRALAAYANQVIRKEGIPALLKWAASVPDTTPGDMGSTNYKLEVYRNVGTALVPYDVEAAKKFCDAHCEGPHGSNLRSRIATRWARIDAASALDWLAAAPKNQDTNLAIRITYAIWCSNDTPAALAWMKGKLGEKADWVQPTLPVYARWLGKKEPVEALGVATGLSDPKEREVVQVDIARGWRQRDEKAAEAWLAQSSFSAEQLDKVRAPETDIERMKREEAAKVQPAPPTTPKA